MYLLAGEDYTSINMDFTFGPSTSRLCVNVSLTDDDLLEMKENFTLDLTSDDPSVMLQPDRAVVEINDNDRELSSMHYKFYPTFSLLNHYDPL